MPSGTELTPLQEPVPGSVLAPESSQNQLSIGGALPDVCGMIDAIAWLAQSCSCSVWQGAAMT